VTTIGAQSPFEVGNVSIVGGSNERVEKTSLIGRVRGCASAVQHVLTCARHHLPRAGLFNP
jgi:hypothetical protein